jgi:hypothetical protein
MLSIFFFGSKQGGEGGTYVHGTYDNASSPSFVGHLWINAGRKGGGGSQWMATLVVYAAAISYIMLFS